MRVCRLRHLSALKDSVTVVVPSGGASHVGRMMTDGAEQPGQPGPGSDAIAQLQLERYKYILQQMNIANEGTYRYLGLYQALAVTLGGAILGLFAGYKRWGIEPHIARTGVVGLMGMLTVVACFATLMIVVGVFSWIDYRREECEFTDKYVHSGFRSPPRLKNFVRWHETYVVLLILLTVVLIWVYVTTAILPGIR